MKFFFKVKGKKSTQFKFLVENGVQNRISLSFKSKNFQAFISFYKLTYLTNIGGHWSFSKGIWSSKAQKPVTLS